MRKTGPVYDLPLLLAVLCAAGQLEQPLPTTAFWGRTGMDGTLRPVSGVLPMALTRRRKTAYGTVVSPQTMLSRLWKRPAVK